MVATASGNEKNNCKDLILSFLSQCTYHVGDAHDGKEERSSVFVDAARDGEIHDKKGRGRAAQRRKDDGRGEYGEVQITKERDICGSMGRVAGFSSSLLIFFFIFF